MPKLPAITAVDLPALFLDFDGTLVDIVARPDLTRVSPQLIKMLKDTYRCLDGALAIVSGRPLKDLDRLLTPLKLPAAGIHGIEHRNASGRIESRCQIEIPADAHRRLKTLAGSHAGLIFEDKGYSLGVHYRLAPDLEAKVRSTFDDIIAMLGPEFSVQDGKMVLELRPSGIDKGSAIEKFMSEAPFTGRHVIYIGDDITDEDGFSAANRLGGYSIKVGTADSGSAARYTLDDVSGVHAWLKQISGRSI